jgi:Ca-activated chloride channel family protein
MLKREDFNNDRIDAGEIGAGHSVTALYEIALNDSKGLRIDPLRYQTEATFDNTQQKEIAFLRLRYKQPDADKSRLLEWPIKTEEIIADISRTSSAYRFAAAVAAFAQTLRGGERMEGFGYAEIMTLAQKARGDDPFGYRGEFLGLVNVARSLSTEQHASNQQAGFNIN